MKTIELKIELPKDLKLSPEEADKTPVDLAKELIKNVILSFGASQRGFKEDERRQYYKIQDELDLKSDSVELEDTEFGFLKKCFREVNLMPNPLLRQIEEIIAAVKDR